MIVDIALGILLALCVLLGLAILCSCAMWVVERPFH